MAFLRIRDYFTEIRETDLDDILEQTSQTTAKTLLQVRQNAEFDVQEIIATHLRHRYDERKFFPEIIPFVKADTYQINDLVEYSETPYDVATTYVLGNRVSFQQTISTVLNDDIFEANASVAAGETPATTPGKWDNKTENFSLFHAEQITTGVNPDTTFSFTANNFTGNHDTILGWDKTKTIFLKRIETRIRIYYTAADRTNDTNSIGVVDFDPSVISALGHHHDHRHNNHIHLRHQAHDDFDRAVKQFPTNIPIQFGTDRENSLSGDLSIIGFTPDTQEWDVVPSNSFIKGDNRNRMVKNLAVVLTIFQLHKLINPRNIPDIRIDARAEAMILMKKISTGKVTADLPIFHDDQKGQNITYGSQPKLSHRY